MHPKHPERTQCTVSSLVGVSDQSAAWHEHQNVSIDDQSAVWYETVPSEHFQSSCQFKTAYIMPVNSQARNKFLIPSQNGNTKSVLACKTTQGHGSSRPILKCPILKCDFESYIIIMTIHSNTIIRYAELKSKMYCNCKTV